MKETTSDLLEQRLRAALRALRDDSPANALARASILASVAGNPDMQQVAIEETAYPQAELDVHLQTDIGAAHSTRADWLGRFVSRLSYAVNDVTKSMTKRKRMSPGLQVFAPSRGSVRLVVRAPTPAQSHPEQFEGADDTSAESRALALVTHLLKLSEDPEPDLDSPITALTRGLTPRARQRMRGIAASIIETGWEVSGTLSQRGRVLEEVRVDNRAAQRLYDKLNEAVVDQTRETVQGIIDGQRRSLSTMWFIPDGASRAYEVAVADLELLEAVKQLDREGQRVQCRFVVYLTIPAGDSEASARSRELESIEPIAPATPLLD